MGSLRRLLTLQGHLGAAPKRGFATSTAVKMATDGKLNINSKYRLKSGFDIPVLGFGVR